MNQAELAVSKYDDLRRDEHDDGWEFTEKFLGDVLNEAEFKNEGYNFPDGSRITFMRQYIVIGDWKAN